MANFAILRPSRHQLCRQKLILSENCQISPFCLQQDIPPGRLLLYLVIKCTQIYMFYDKFITKVEHHNEIGKALSSQ